MIGTSKQVINWLLEKSTDIKYEIKKFKDYRGLQANKYYWSLVGKISVIIKSSIEETHFELLKKYGIMEYISIRADIPPQDYFKYYVKDNEYQLGKNRMSSYKVYKESHLMNTKEFSHLLEMTIGEAKDLGIEILEDKKIKEMMDQYEKRNS